MSSRKKKVFKNLILGTLGLFAIVCGAMLIWLSSIELPDFSSFDSRKVIESTKIYDRTGEVVLYDLNSDVKRTRIDYTEMGVNIKNATVAIEDSNFYQHYGFRPKAFIRAVIANITSGSFSQGGSTITQQVIKKSLLVDEKTIIRKLKEIILALKLDKDYSKDEILGIYLNEIPYGGNIYGISEASRTFFGKTPKDLTLAESAYLAAIPNAPTRYSPYGNNKDLLESRKNLVLSRMLEVGFINAEEFTQAKEEVVEFKPQESRGIKAPHFVFFIKDYLEQRYGADIVESGGLKVITTLDYDMQQDAEESIIEFTLGENRQIDDGNAGLIAIDPKTGQILTMVGSRNYFDTDIDGNFNVTLARRQPGSSFKPYVYATAFKKGYTPETILFDVPTEFNSSCSPYHIPGPGIPSNQCYMPQNYDGKYHGPMSIRSALARSMNVPAVKMLYMVGVSNAIKTAQDMGITTLADASRYGLALVLGGGEVRLLEMTSAYGAFANNGIRNPYSGVLRVEDKNGTILEEWSSREVEVIPKNVTLQISDVLSDNTARTPTFGANSALHIPGRQVAVKTGTTNDFKDSWTIGYTPSLVVGVWRGKNDNTPMPVAVNAAPLWRSFMNKTLSKYPNESFESPIPDPDYINLPPVLRGSFQGGESFTIDTISGKLATELTPKETQKEFVITNVHNILHWVKKEDPKGGKPENPENDSLYRNFEVAVQDWWSQNKGNYPQVTGNQRPTEYDDIHTPANKPVITIINTPQSVLGNTPLTLQFTIIGTFPTKKTDIFMNNVFIGSTQNTSFTFTPDNIPATQDGQNTISLVTTDLVYNTGTTSFNILVR